jgi:hypothetical protein
MKIPLFNQSDATSSGILLTTLLLASATLLRADDASRAP